MMAFAVQPLLRARPGLGAATEWQY